MKEIVLSIFTFSFEEDVPSLYNEFKNQEKQINGKKSTSVQKNIHRFKKIIKGVLSFCKHMPGKT